MTLDEDLKRLKDAAVAASGNAYCPYSRFQVGAVVVTDSGDEFTGCNVENASFGLTSCAERNAVFQMVSASGRQRIKLVVIYTPTDTPAAPCGACRQVIYEFGPEARVISLCDSDRQLISHIQELLPNAFGYNLND